MLTALHCRKIKAEKGEIDLSLKSKDQWPEQTTDADQWRVIRDPEWIVPDDESEDVCHSGAMTAGYA